MDNKPSFNLNNYNFKIVTMDVFSGTYDDKENDFTYYLLVDDDNFIHDYKFEFRQIRVTLGTTASHNKSPWTERLVKRVEMLELMGLKHRFSGKETVTINDLTIINKLNDWIKEERWNEITFQNHEYMLRGCNPSGQGKNNGFFKTRYGKLDFCFGFFFQILNIHKEICAEYETGTVVYDSIWDEFYKHNTVSKITFINWIKHTKLENYFKEFVFNSVNWKNTKEKFAAELNKSKQDFINTEKVINRLRGQYVRAIAKKIGDTETVVKKYFGDVKSTEFEHAHIKPVYQIRAEYMATKKGDKLEEIADIDNFLPLPPTVHRLYDKKYFYWSPNGKLMDVRKFEKSDILGFDKIQQNAIANCKKYLHEYYKLISKEINE